MITQNPVFTEDLKVDRVLVVGTNLDSAAQLVVTRDSASLQKVMVGMRPLQLVRPALEVEAEEGLVDLVAPLLGEVEEDLEVPPEVGENLEVPLEVVEGLGVPMEVEGVCILKTVNVTLIKIKICVE